MGSSGGGGSGAVDYPEYMKTKHEGWLNALDALIGSAIANNPYETPSESPYDPTSSVSAMITALVDFETYLDDYESGPGLADDVAEMSTILTNAMNADDIPNFEAGMRDINAVQTSTFVIGKALITSRKGDQLARYSAEQSFKVRQLINEQRKSLAVAYVEAYRLGIVAQKEYFDEWIEFETAAVKWDLELYTYGGNMLAAIGGGHSGMGQPAKPSKAQSAIGGAMAGAAIGSAVAPGVGTAAGAIIGGIGGFFA